MGVGRQRHAPATLPPGKRSGAQCRGGQVDPRAGLDGCRKCSLDRDCIPGPPSLQGVAMPTTLSQSTHAHRWTEGVSDPVLY